MTPTVFPKISDDEMRRMLSSPRGPVRIVIDTDTKNEIDDQFALTWVLLSQDVLKLEAIYAALAMSFTHGGALGKRSDHRFGIDRVTLSLLPLAFVPSRTTAGFGSMGIVALSSWFS